MVKALSLRETPAPSRRSSAQGFSRRQYALKARESGYSCRKAALPRSAANCLGVNFVGQGVPEEKDPSTQPSSGIILDQSRTLRQGRMPPSTAPPLEVLPYMSFKPLKPDSCGRQKIIHAGLAVADGNPATSEQLSDPAGSHDHTTASLSGQQSKPAERVPQLPCESQGSASRKGTVGYRMGAVDLIEQYLASAVTCYRPLSLMTSSVGPGRGSAQQPSFSQQPSLVQQPWVGWPDAAASPRSAAASPRLAAVRTAARTETRWGAAGTDSTKSSPRAVEFRRVVDCGWARGLGSSDEPGRTNCLDTLSGMDSAVGGSVLLPSEVPMLGSLIMTCGYHSASCANRSKLLPQRPRAGAVPLSPEAAAWWLITPGGLPPQPLRASKETHSVGELRPLTT